MTTSMQAILAAYERAKEDPKAAIPTPLMLAIEDAKRRQQGASPYEERRATPRPEHDLDIFSRPLKAGS